MATANQDYKLVVRSVWGGASVRDGSDYVVQNLGEFTDYLNELYLAEGYKILSVDYLGETTINELEGTNSPRALRFGYHLVK